MMRRSILLFIISLGLIYLSSYFNSQNRAIDSAITQVDISYFKNGEKDNVNLSNQEFVNRKKQREERIKVLESKKYPNWIKYISTTLLIIAGILISSSITFFRRYWMKRKKA